NDRAKPPRLRNLVTELLQSLLFLLVGQMLHVAEAFIDKKYHPTVYLQSDYLDYTHSQQFPIVAHAAETLERGRSMWLSKNERRHPEPRADYTRLGRTHGLRVGQDGAKKAVAFIQSKVNVCLRACNLAMLTKWWWRFLHESNTLWKNVIISIHGQKGGLFSRILPTVSKRHWNAINTLQKPLSVININLQSIFVKRIGDGMSTLFWKDVGIGETPLFDRLVTTKIVEFLIDAVWPFTRNWAWRRNVRNGPEQSQLNDLLDLLKDFSPVPSPDLQTGLDLDSVRCPTCNDDLETAQHVFVDCSVANNLWNMISVWWGFNNFPSTLVNLISWSDTTNLSPTMKTCFDAVISQLMESGIDNHTSEQGPSNSDSNIDTPVDQDNSSLTVEAKSENVCLFLITCLLTL
ncbi:hypothetical protein Tco_0826921, partial [Tanacetum coccineum]